MQINQSDNFVFTTARLLRMPAARIRMDPIFQQLLNSHLIWVAIKIRGGSKGRVQGVCIPPAGMTRDFRMQLHGILRNTYVVYCHSLVVHSLLKTNPGSNP